MTSVPPPKVKFQPHSSIAAEQQAAPATPLKGILRSDSQTSPKKHVRFFDDTMRTPPTLSREALLQHIKEIKTEFDKIHAIENRINKQMEDLARLTSGFQA